MNNISVTSVTTDSRKFHRLNKISTRSEIYFRRKKYIFGENPNWSVKYLISNRVLDAKFWPKIQSLHSKKLCGISFRLLRFFSMFLTFHNLFLQLEGKKIVRNPKTTKWGLGRFTRLTTRFRSVMSSDFEDQRAMPPCHLSSIA